MNEIPEDWFEQLLEAHVWSEPKLVSYSGKDPLFGRNIYETRPNTRECTICSAVDRGWGAQYLSCQMLTIYPADDSPCRCSRRDYLKAHKII